MRRDILAALRDADASLREVRVPASADARVRAALAATTTTKRPVWLVVSAAAAGVLVAALLWQTPALEGERSQAVAVTLGADGRVEERGGALYLLAGSATFEVRPRAAGEAPVVVHMGEARIEVMGTRFTVSLSSQEGHVRLERGSIRLVDADGVSVMMRPGEERTFPLQRQLASATPSAMMAPVPVTTSEPVSERAVREQRRLARTVPTPAQVPDVDEASLPRPAPAPAPSAAEVDAAVARITALRTTGENQLALVELDRVLALKLEPRTAETLSFEKGLLLEDLEDERACSQWQAHAERFPNGRYVDAVVQARTRLSCAAE